MDQIRVIGISCSPRAHSNTDSLIHQVLETASKQSAVTEFTKASEMRILPCDACWTCKETGVCRINDDMQSLYPKLKQADGIVIGTPVHMGHNVSGNAQIFLDRTFPFWHTKELQNKVGGSIAVGNRRGGICSVRAINDVLIDQHMIIAGYVTGYALAAGDIRKDERAFNEAAALGNRLCQLLGMLK
jgi:multimeric flavodoxin WrbA